MNRSILLVLTTVFLIHSACQLQKSDKALTCEDRSIPDLPNVTVTSVIQETEMAPHCKVAGIIGNDIKFELLLPHDWNGKFVMGGGGGFVGSVINTALGYGVLQKGYATVGTDTGHEGHPIDGSWAMNNPEAIVNFGHIAVHRTAETAKAITELYYGKEIEYSYFFGCSRGGGQAMMEAQRYPEDFDGIIAGAPAYNWTKGMGAGMIHNMKYMYPDPNSLDEPLISQEDLKLIETSYLAECDELDGIKDGILTDPRACNFDVGSLLCSGQKNASCLTAEQVKALKAIYEGPKDGQGPLYYGFPLGGETHKDGWFKWLTGGFNHLEQSGEFHEGIASDFEAPQIPNAQFGFGMGVMQNLIFHDQNWSYADYDFNNFREDSRIIANTLNSVDPDLSEFRAQGGKLLMYTGWSDAAITPLGTIGYYESVIANDPTASDDVRLFMMPGVLHCLGGDGPSWVNWVDELDKWVTSGENPEEITVHYIDENFQPQGSRLLCAYPEIAVYDGLGDDRDVLSFSCGSAIIE
jgi:feruloyl esterase